MKIGILIKEFEKLENWELRIFDYLLNSDFFDLVLLIKDGRKISSKNSKKLIKKAIYNKNFFGKLIFHTHSWFERKIFKFKKLENKESIISRLKLIETIDLSPKSKGYLDIFDNKHAKLINKYKLDIILLHEFNIIKGPILNSSKYGIWSFHHADNSINRGRPAGFYETFLNQKYVGITLQQLSETLDSGRIIDKGFFNTHWSFIKTNNLILESSVSLLIKNLEKLRNSKFETIESMVYYNPLYKVPTFTVALRYILKFYFTLLKKIIQYLKSQIIGLRYHSWTLVLGKGNFLNSNLYKLKALKISRNEFWADPFIFSFNNKKYVFFENFEYKKNKGKISCCELDGLELKNTKDVLDLEYHLSYPFIFKKNNDIFLMPESSSNNCLEIYKCVDFPTKWKIHKTKFEGQKIIDATIFEDNNGDSWLFFNKQASEYSSPHAELFIYKIEDFETFNLVPHSKNPIYIDSRVARSAGPIFKHNENFCRPSQANIYGYYGHALNINKIKKLTLNEYEEDKITTVYPNFFKNLSGIHHLHQTEDDLFIFDIACNAKL